MLSLSVSAFFAFIAQAPAKENDQHRAFRLEDRAFHDSHTEADLDRTMLGKPGHLTVSSSTVPKSFGHLSTFRDLPASARSRSRSPLLKPPRSHSGEHDATSFTFQSGGAVSRRDALSATFGLGTAALLPRPRIANAAEAQVKVDPKVYIAPPSAAGKRILITGSNTGLGLESAKRLAQAGAKVIVTGRTQGKADAALAQVKAVAPDSDVRALVLDLANLESIKSFPAKYNEALGNAPLDVLLENAGVMAIPEKLTTADGFERQVGINHLGHFALVAGMMPVLRKAADGFRIITVSSEAHKFATEGSMKAALDSNLDPPEYSQWGNYGLSKAANVLFAKELQRRFDDAGIRASAVTLHPGAVQTDLARYLIQGTEAAENGVPLVDTAQAMNPLQKVVLQGVAKLILPVEQGANTQIFLAAGADGNGELTKNGGEYFVDMKVAKPLDFVNSKQLAAKLWEVSETLTGTKIPI
eukprot:gnl/MRDRNA2_/MRDRNA2_30278_c0_seq1.p1 gnl/MRDRNA2_/MRDRNA2_30278_c0~~gnl/MRDRNA2_/MRDRNA2_30278_c0_seq1.p1  ORF type:complete len:471 (-),score=104.46 gnl/MRDRNA2_/MRDRNA2_30278_c0_seq1:247-1659(-)